VVVLTVALLASGVALLFVCGSGLSLLLKVHKASFILSSGTMTIHVPGHLVDVVRFAPRDWVRRARRDAGGAGIRQWLIAASLAIGALAGVLVLSRIGPWLAVSSQ
jgi:alpha-D-ribose 1-methylphosphonate 5-triphosphate synthase subunit PhnL